MNEIIKPSGKHALLIDGKAASVAVLARVAAEAATLAQKPGLAVVLVGSDPASQVYVRNKNKAAAEIGLHSIEHVARDTSAGRTDRAGRRSTQIPRSTAFWCNCRCRPIDAAGAGADRPRQGRGRLSSRQCRPRRDGAPTRWCPARPLGCLHAAADAKVGGHRRRARHWSLGRSNIVGKPMAQLLLARNPPPSPSPIRAPAICPRCRRADILVAAVGRPEMVRGDWIKPGAMVIDVGINRVPAKA